MNYKNDLIETSRSHLGLGVDIGRAALQPVYIPGLKNCPRPILCDWVASALVGHCIQYHEGSAAAGPLRDQQRPDHQRPRPYSLRRPPRLDRL